MTTEDGMGRDGGCRCGKVRFRVEGRSVMSMACHCKGCQRLTASAFSLAIVYPAGAFALTAGETVLGGLHRDEQQHHFCPSCLSWVFSQARALGEFTAVRAALLDDALDFAPFIETCVDEKLAWARTPAAHSFAQFPAPDEFPALFAEYARRAG